MERNAIILGYSLPRVLMIALICLSLLIYGIMMVLFNRRSDLKSGFNLYLRKQNKIIYILSFCLLAVVFEILAMLIAVGENILFLGFITVIFQRGFLFITWCLFVNFLLLISMLYLYKDVVINRSNWQCAFENPIQFLKRVPPSGWVFSLVTFLAVAIMLAYSPDFAGQTPKHDSGIFLYFGSRILKGDVPFRDLWDHKPPLVFYIDALGLWLSNGSIWGVWFLEVVSLIASALMLFKALQKEISLPAIFLVVTGFVTNVVFPNEGGNFTEEFGIPFQCMTLLLLSILVMKGQKRLWLWFLIGGLMGMALMLKQTLIGIWVALLIVYAYKYITADKSVRIRDFFGFLGGLAIVTLLWVAYFYFNNALWDFWDVAYRFNFLYSDISMQDRLEAISTIFWVLLTASWFYYFGLAVWASFVGRGWGYLKKLPVLLLVALVDFPIEIFLISLSGKNYNHYFFTLLPCFAILLGYGWNYGIRLINNRSFKVGLFILVFVMIIFKPVVQIVAVYHQPPEAAVAEAVQYIRRSTKENDYVILWGSITFNGLSRWVKTDEMATTKIKD